MVKCFSPTDFSKIEVIAHCEWELGTREVVILMMIFISTIVLYLLFERTGDLFSALWPLNPSIFVH